MAANSPKPRPRIALWATIALAVATVWILAPLLPLDRQAEGVHGRQAASKVTAREAPPDFAVAVPIAGSREDSAGLVAKLPAPTPVRRSTEPAPLEPKAPDGYDYTSIVPMTTAKLPTPIGRPVPAARPPEWQELRHSRSLVLHQASRAGRDWTFAWIRLAGGQRIATLRKALEPLGAVVLGAAGADVRVRVPASAERLHAIAALPGVLGLGATPTEVKADVDFVANARAQPATEVVPVFVTLMASDSTGRWRRELEALGVAVGAWDPSLRSYAANLPFGALDAVLDADFVLAVEPVTPVRAAHDTAVPVMAADALRSWSSASRQFRGTTGTAIPVGVMDTGLNLSHPDITSGRRSICGANFRANEDYDLWRDLAGHQRGGGHGTHVTGTLLGAGVDDPLMAGMAPGIRHLRFAKVLPTRSGSGRTDDVNRAMDYFAEASGCSREGEQADPVRPLLVNMSLAATGLEFSGRGVGERKLDATVWASRQLYVVAQANSGVHGVSNYATAKNSLAVGAAADSGTVASFSSHGPTADGRLAPNVVATGVDVSSVRGQGRSSGYVSLSGTSMASPAVAGMAALLMDAEPGFREQPALARARIMASAVRPDAFLGDRFPADNSGGPGEIQNRYGLGLASARLSVLQRDRPDGWRSGAAMVELADDEYAYVDVDVPEGAHRLDIVMTWDEGPAEAVTESVLNDLDLWVDAGADCGPGACGERSSRSRIDNVEWVFVRQPAAGTHRLKIVPERIHGRAPRAAVAWTLIRGKTSPKLRVEPANATIRAAAGQPAQVELTVSVDGYVAAGSTLHLGSRDLNGFGEAGVETEREDALSRHKARRLRDTITLGEIAAGEEQRLRLAISADQSDRLYFTASAWNAEAGTASVDILIAGNERLPALATVPGNDGFDQAESITGHSGERAFDLMLASREPGEPDVHAQLSTASDGVKLLRAARTRSAWFTWRAPGSGTWFFRVGEAGRLGERVGGIDMAVFQGERIAELQQVGANDDSAIAFSAERGQVYRIRIASTLPDVKPYLLRWEGGDDDRPPNDDFAYREHLTGPEGSVSGSNQGASLEPEEFFGDITSTVWYAWTAPEDGYHTFRAQSRRVHVFVGDSITNLRLVSSTQFSSSATFPAAAGRTYRIAVGSEGTETAGGAFELSWEAQSDELMAENDAFINATTILGRQGGVAGISLSRATVEDGEPTETGTNTRWWRWQAPGPGPYTLRLSGNDQTLSTLSVFSGNELGRLRRLDSGHELVIRTDPGETYAISVGKRHEASFQRYHRGDLGFSWGETPANDRPAAASPLRGASGRVEASHAFATSSPDEPVAVAAHSSLWWRWTAPATGWYRFQVERRESLGSRGQSLLAIYRAGADGQPEFIGSTDRNYVLNGELEVTLRAVKGARHLVQVAPRAGEDPQEIRFTWNPADPPRWLRYRGLVADGDPLPTGSALSINGPRALAIDDTGQRLFVNDRDKLIVLALDSETGSPSLAGVIPHRDADGTELSGLVDARMHWDANQGLLYGVKPDYGRVIFHLADLENGFVEPCNNQDPPGFSFGIDQIAAIDRHLYLMASEGVLVYRIDSGCDWTLVQTFVDERLDSASRVLRHNRAAAEPGGKYIHFLSGEASLATLARNPDTGRLSLESTVDLGAVSHNGTAVRMPRSITSIATDASGPHLFLFGNSGPELAAFDLRASPGTPEFAASLQEYHLPSSLLRTHLVWPPWDGHCYAHSTFVETAAAICHDAVYAVELGADGRTLRLSDYISVNVPDRFGNNIPSFGSPHRLLQSPDGAHLYALASQIGDVARSIVAFEHSTATESALAVKVVDRNLRAALEAALRKAPGEPIGDVEMASLTRLDAARRGIVDLTGLESAHSLTELNLWGNRIVDLSPLHGLTTLKRLDLGANRVIDLWPLAELDNLTWLNLGGNRIADISALAGLASLEHLSLHGNRISNLPNIDLPKLKELSLWGNRIRDITALADLTTLVRLDLAGNRIADVTPLLDNDGLRNGARVDLRGNPIDIASIDSLADRGANLLHGMHRAPAADYFPTRLDLDRQGFVRIVNRSSRSGEVRILPTDETGKRATPLWLFLGAGETAHFNSDDLETGNPGKGLVGRTGTGMESWRLAFESGLPIEVLTYLRTADGFLTALHDTVPCHESRHRVATFNPASNFEQESFLRLVNTGASPADVVIEGVDDLGQAGKGSVRLAVAAGASRSVAASELESGGSQMEGALGDGTGKWRLEVEADGNVRVMNLLRSPTGHLSNLSTMPVEPVGASAAMHQVPLFPATSDPLGRQGFVRVINKEPRAGEVRIDTFDDSGRAYDPIRLSVEANAATHFNSQDLESGNRDKGLVGRTGAGAGDWRLTLSSDLDIEVLAYDRTHGGFLAAMHDLAPLLDGRYRVAIFNPSSNDRQVSLLRLINPGDETARIAIVGTDDRGRSPGDTVSLTLGPGASRSLTAWELERGGEDLKGSLLDGQGKWRLAIESDQPLLVMSLLASPTGHLTNLSTMPQTSSVEFAHRQLRH